MDKIKDLDQYMLKIGQTRLLSAEEEQKLFEAVRNGGAESETAKRELMDVHQRLVVPCANQYQNRGLTLIELIEAGNVGLEKAIVDFGMERDVKFPHLAVAYMRREILRAIGGGNDLLKDVFYGKKYLDSFQPHDIHWLKTLADKGDVYAICCLLMGMNRKDHSWHEMFVDEDTNEEVDILRCDIEDGTTFEKDEELETRLTQMLYDAKERMSDDDLRNASSLPIDSTPLMMELIRRGDEEAATYIDDKVILQYLCQKGNKYAAYQLYHKNLWGDVEHGFFINKTKARPYFELAKKLGYEFREEELDDLDEEDEPGEEYPESFKYTLSGDTATINAIRMLIDDLCERFGTPGNELGLYVPQRILMRVLVGSNTEYYRGNVIRMEQEGANRLVIETEAEQGDPLFYALRHAFRGLNVEVEEIDW